MNTLNQANPDVNPRRGFRLNKTDAKFMGVCAGIADTTGWDVNLIRIALALGTVFGFGSLLLVYLVIGLVAD